ncbi:MAG: transporter [Bacteroidales bacterium]|nr:transporter [Bacteroidales bacterium]
MVNKVLTFVKNWTLPISMLTGILIYIIYYVTPALHPFGATGYTFVTKAQPVLIFMMLFLQFNRVSPHDLKITWWHIILMLVQCVAFVALALVAAMMEMGFAKIIVECAMLCMICPTATAAGVVTGKLGGSVAHTMSYVVLINCAVSLLIPAIVPLVESNAHFTFIQSFWLILKKVFPLLIMPCITAWIIRYGFRKVQIFFMRYADMAFYFWSVGLMLALIVTTRQFIRRNMTLVDAVAIGLASFATCAFQFWIGRRVGRPYGHSESVTAGQACGQKNTMFMIWLGYTFLTPETSVAGGFYSIWHNLVNSYELYRARKKAEKEAA